MRLRPLAPLLAAVLAVSLTACGSDESTGGEAEPEASSEAETEEPEDPAATGEDYATLTRTLFESGNTEGAASAEQLNRRSDFPEGVSVEEFEEQTRTICIQDQDLDIAMRFVASEEGGLFLLEGLCEDGEEVSEIGPDEDDPDAVSVQGDEELGQPVADYFTERFGSEPTP